MNETQIKNQVKRIEMMDKTQLEEFTQKVHSTVGMSENMFKEFMVAIDARHKALANSFSFEVEYGDIKDGEKD